MKILNKSKQTAKKGFSLIELIIVLAVFGALSVIVLLNGSSVRDGQRIASETDTLMMGVASVQSIYSGTGYASVDSETLAGMASFPNSMKNNSKTGLRNAWGGDVFFEGQSDGDTFTITYDGIPDDVCDEFRIRNMNEFSSVSSCQVDSASDETSKLTFTSY